MEVEAFSTCGKGLWKNLWRLWKSMSFQQLFRIITTLHPEKIHTDDSVYVENCSVYIKLCRRGNLEDICKR